MKDINLQETQNHGFTQQHSRLNSQLDTVVVPTLERALNLDSNLALKRTSMCKQCSQTFQFCPPHGSSSRRLTTICVPGTCTKTDNHVCSRACTKTYKGRIVFKDLNLSMYESKELVNNQSREQDSVRCFQRTHCSSTSSTGPK